MMRALAFDLGKYNIRVNAVLPGMIKTDRWENNYNDCRNALSNLLLFINHPEFRYDAKNIKISPKGRSKDLLRD